MLYNGSMRIGLCVRTVVYVCIKLIGTVRISHTFGWKSKLTKFEYAVTKSLFSCDIVNKKRATGGARTTRVRCCNVVVNKWTNLMHVLHGAYAYVNPTETSSCVYNTTRVSTNILKRITLIDNVVTNIPFSRATGHRGFYLLSYLLIVKT